MIGQELQSLPARTEFYFLRHGESEGNREGRIQGREDSPLSATGLEHARSAAKWFADKSIELVYTSPLIRSASTASEVARVIGLPDPVVLDDLVELDAGVLAGRRGRELAEEDPELYARFRARSWEAIPGAESAQTLMDRARRVWKKLVEDALGGIIKATMPLEHLSWMPIFPASNCGVFKFAAQSTTDESNRYPCHEGFYGAWELVNHTPYELNSAASTSFQRSNAD
jgi:broad specificity phosphatase PhoE